MDKNREYHYVSADFTQFGGIPNHRVYEGRSLNDAEAGTYSIPALLSNVGLTGPVLVEISTHNYKGQGSTQTSLRRFVYWIAPAKFVHDSNFFLVAKDEAFYDGIPERIKEVVSRIPEKWLPIISTSALQ